jgi:cellulose synthase/poly-beta-1,6-N-acetylglucosamine synthase-like glycosyltransferase
MFIPTLIVYCILFLALYIQIYLLIGFFKSGGTRRSDTTPLTISPSHLSTTLNLDTGGAYPESLPTVSIIVPCWNEEKTVTGTLRSLLALDYPTEKLSVIVVDDGSTDSTYSVAKEVADEAGSMGRITLIQKENGGKCTAMNRALEETTSDLIGCLDADSFVSPQALLASVKHFGDPLVAAVTPAIYVHQPQTLLQFIQKAEYGLSMFVRRALADSDSVFITPGPFSIFRRSLVMEAGGWRHAHGTEDMEIALRLRHLSSGSHYKITNEPGVEVFTSSPPTIPKLYKQRVRWTYGFIMNTWDYRHMFFEKKYGALGIIVLPTALISIFAALYMAGYALTFIYIHLHSLFIKYSVTHISTADFLVRPQLYYTNTTMLVLLMYIMIGLTIYLMTIGKQLGSRREGFSWDIPIYLITYGFLAPLWLFGAVVRALFGRQAPWR